MMQNKSIQEAIHGKVGSTEKQHKSIYDAIHGKYDALQMHLGCKTDALMMHYMTT